MTAAWRWLPAAVIAGALLGVFSSLGDGVRIMVVNGLANATSPWVLAAFAAGVLAGAPRPAAVAGGTVLLVGVWAYYLGFLVDGNAFLLPPTAIWSVAAAAAGALFGAAGGAWRSRDDRWRALSAAAVIGALLAEAAQRLILIEIWTGFEWDRTYVQVAVADLVLAAALLLLLADRGRRAGVLARAIPMALALLLALYGVNLVLGWASDLGIG